MLGACAQPENYASGPMIAHDQHTKFSRENTENGFVLNVNYERYQFIPESSAVATACERNAISLAYELAESEGNDLKPINHDRIRLSMGRNGITGITSCSISVPVFYSDGT
jgi:hypothetical protein